MEEVQVYDKMDENTFRELIKNDRKPAIIRNLDIGPCLTKWTPEYLIEAVKSPVKIHVSTESKMDFIKKNFVYKTVAFDELIARTCGFSKDYFIKENEFYYLRSLGSDVRSKDVADISVQYPKLAKDITVPNLFDSCKFFSSVLRVSSSNASLWTHYDIMDNILVQVQGRKKMVLWPPNEANNMYLTGDKSSVIDIDHPDESIYPKFVKAARFECILYPGDILFIPSLWFHNATALDMSIAVNVFWKHLDDEFYDNKDTYGNKDLILAARALQMVDNSFKHLDKLPQIYQDFYLRRMLTNIENKLEILYHDKVDE